MHLSSNGNPTLNPNTPQFQTAERTCLAKQPKDHQSSNRPPPPSAAHRTLTARTAGICAALIALLATGAPANTADAAFAAATRTVPCDESIDTTPFPYLGNSQPHYRYRSVLNAIAVPPAYLQQVIATRQQRTRRPREASGHHHRAASLASAGRDHRGTAATRLPHCESPPAPHYGNAYAGGFYSRGGGGGGGR
jgi:hypothetical protein